MAQQSSSDMNAAYLWLLKAHVFLRNSVRKSYLLSHHVHYSVTLYAHSLFYLCASPELYTSLNRNASKNVWLRGRTCNTTFSQKIIAETLFYDKQKEPVPQFIIKLINSRQTSFPFTTDLGGNHVTAEGKELLKPL